MTMTLLCEIFYITPLLLLCLLMWFLGSLFGILRCDWLCALFGMLVDKVLEGIIELK